MRRFIGVALVLLALTAIVIRQGKLFGENISQAKSKKVESNQVEGSISLQQAKIFFPQATSLKLIDTAWVAVYADGGEKLGDLLLSSPYSDKVIGFNGTTPLLIAIDGTEKIVGVKLLDNEETPGYVKRVEKAGFFNSWNGLTVSDALAKNVDVVSGATYTSTGVIKSLQARLSVVDSSKFKPVAKPAIPFDWSSILKHVLIILILALALYSFFRPAKAKKLRIPLLLLSVAVLGFWQGSMLSLAQLYSWLINGASLATQWSLLLVLLFAIALPLFTGKAFYCIYVCPFGAAQELVGKLNKRKLQLGQKVVHWLMMMRKAILIAIALLFIIGLEFDLSLIEPFSAFNVSVASIAAITIAGVSLVLSIFITKPWCRFLCPTGQTLDFIKKKHDIKK